VSHSFPFHSSGEQHGFEYCAQLLRDAVPTESGIAYLLGDEEALLEWSRVRFAIVAEVGEPEGVRTIVFDLLVERTDSRLVAFRLDADPCEKALPLAVAIASFLSPERTAASLKTMASEGNPCLWFPDLGSFEVAAVEMMRRH
jgi:hypothetical protein